jgi:O-antigen ligase
MNREALDKFFERGILALVLAILVFAPLAFGAVDAWAFLVVQGLTIGVMLLWALRLRASPKPKLLWPPICWVVLAFTIYAVARYFTADIEYVARQEMIQVLMYAFLFFAIVNNLYRQEFSQIISFTLIFLAMAISSYAGYQFLTHSHHVWNAISPYPGRAAGTYISPNNLAGFLEMLLPLVVAYILVGRMKPLTRILLGYTALVMAAGMVVTFSRGGWAAVGIGLLALLGILLRHRNHRWSALALLIVLIGGGIFFFAHYLSKSAGYMTHVKSSDSGSIRDIDVRLDLWSAAEKMWHDNFWWGVGPGHFDYRFREYRPETVQTRPDRAHNDYLNLLADWGTIGGIIVLGGLVFFIAGLSRTWRHVRRSENHFGSGQSNRFAFYLGASTGLLALAVHSGMDFNLHVPANAIVGVTLLALLTSNLRFATERYWFNLRLPVKALLTAALAGGVIYFGGQEWRLGHEAGWLVRARRLPEFFSPERTADLEKAFAAEPMNFETAYDIGETYRVESFEGGQDYEAEAKTAMDWYSRSQKLDRFYGYSFLRYGMCLDWLDQHDQAEKFFNQAEALDPNGYYTVAIVGWHYVQAQDYAAARPWFERSLRLEIPDNGNTIVGPYLELVEKKLVEKAANQGVLPVGFYVQPRRIRVDMHPLAQYSSLK